MNGEWPAGTTTSGDNTHPGYNDIYINAATKLYAALQGAVVGQIPVIEPFSDAENSGYTSVSNAGGTGLTKGGALLQLGTVDWGWSIQLTHRLRRPTQTLCCPLGVPRRSVGMS